MRFGALKAQFDLLSRSEEAKKEEEEKEEEKEEKKEEEEEEEKVEKEEEEETNSLYVGCTNMTLYQLYTGVHAWKFIYKHPVGLDKCWQT